jgi:hypothetical protein
MAFEKVQSLNAETAISLGGFNTKLKKDNPTSIVGYFIGTKIVDSRSSESGKSNLHIFQTSTGNVGVWGKADLDSKMFSVKKGNLVSVTFLEIKQLAKGKMYLYDVEQDRANTIDVAETQAAASLSEEDTGEEIADNEEEAAPDEVAPSRAAAPRTPTQAPSAAAQARAKDLVSRARSARA